MSGCVKPTCGNSFGEIDNFLGCQANPKGGLTASEIAHFTEGFAAGRFDTCENAGEALKASTKGQEGAREARTPSVLLLVRTQRAPPLCVV